MIAIIIAVVIIAFFIYEIKNAKEIEDDDDI
jgi:hypothetical protein